MQGKKVNILIADDHTLFRKGLAMMVSEFDNCYVTKDFNDGKETLNYLKTNSADIVLLDLDMPVMNGFETAKKIIAYHPNCYIIIISMNDSLETIAELIEIGVHSYLLKNAEPNEVKRAITSVINNDFYYNQLVSRALRQNIQKSLVLEPKTNDKSNLTKREIEVLQLICQELNVKEISEQLFLSEQTVLTHRKHLMKKVQAKNAVSLVRFAIQNKIVSF